MTSLRSGLLSFQYFVVSDDVLMLTVMDKFLCRFERPEFNVDLLT